MTGNPTGRKVYRFGSFRFDSERKLLYDNHGLVQLPPKVLDTLAVLLDRAGEIVDKETIVQSIWPDTVVVESALTKNISCLRKVIDVENGEQSSIRTVSKRGYSFVAPVVTEVEMPRLASSSDAALRPHPSLITVAGIALLCILCAIVYGRWSTAAKQREAPEVAREYRIGRHIWGKMERSEIVKAVERFQKATEIDPDSAVAFSGLADAYVMMTTLGVGRRQENLSKAREAAIRAVDLNPKLASPHVSLAYVRRMVDFDPDGAEWHFRQALRLDPDSAPAHHGYACLLMHAGRFDDARFHIDRARQLDPVAPIFGVAAGKLEYYSRRYQHALEVLQDVLNREPEYSQAHYYMAMALGQLGRPREALVHLKRAKLSEPLVATDEAWLQTLLGNMQPARELLANRRDLVAKGAPPVTILLCAIDAGDHDLAIWALQEMLKTRSIELLQINVDPRLDAVRNDPRFVAVARQMFRE